MTIAKRPAASISKTLPDETPESSDWSPARHRTHAVLRAELFLCAVVAVPEDEELNLQLLRREAKVILEHFPRAGDIALSSAQLPNIWALPDDSQYK